MHSELDESQAAFKLLFPPESKPMLKGPNTDSFKLRNLRGAVCEYLDEGGMDEFTEDLKTILKEETVYFKEKMELYESVLNKMFPTEKSAQADVF